MNIRQIKRLSHEQLIEQWSLVWNRDAPPRISRHILELSLHCRLIDRNGMGLTQRQKKRLNSLIEEYKKYPDFIADKRHQLKPGVKLIRRWNGGDIIVNVVKDGYEYEGVNYNSLSKIATKVTGCKRNGRQFFKIKEG
jgi:hypothetical protein